MREIIAELENISEILFNNGYNSWGNTIRKAISTLKEQKEAIETQRDIISTQEEQIDDLQKEQMNKGYSGYDGSFIL